MTLDATQPSPPGQLVITVHGIRTFGKWQERLAGLLRLGAPDVRSESYGYGYFSVLAFLIPPFRFLAVRRFRKEFLDLVENEYPGWSVSIVAHSFGTHIAAHALEGIPKERLPTISLLLLSGSVLRSSFNWTRLADSGKVKRVVNDCGINDHILLLSQLFVLFTGMAGRIGFYGFAGGFKVNRFFAGGHSLYFQPPGPDPDLFMRTHWVPLLLGNAAPLPTQVLESKSWLQGAAYAAMRFADPLKILGYVGVGGLALFYFAILPRQEAKAERASREYVVASRQISANQLVPDAVRTLVRLVEAGNFRTDWDRQRTEELARYGLQRLITRQTALDGVPVGHFFRWKDSIYFHTKDGIKSSIAEPIRFAALPNTDFTLALTPDANPSGEKTAIVLLENRAGTLVKHKSINANIQTDEAVEVLRLRSDPARLIMTLSTYDRKKDQYKNWLAAIDLTKLLFNVSEGYPRLSSDCNSVALAADSDGQMYVRKLASLFESPLPDTSTGQKVASTDAQWIIPGATADTCTEKIEMTPVPPLRFPRAVSDEQLLERKPYEQPPWSPPKCSPVFAATDDDLIRDPASLNWNAAKVPDSGTDPAAVQVLAKEFEASDLCPQVLKGPGGRRYVANRVKVGEENQAWAICELHEERTVGKCVTDLPLSGREDWEYGRGLLLHNKGSDLVALLADDIGFRILRLSDGVAISPDRLSPYETTGIAIDEPNGVVMTAALVPGEQNEVEVRAHALDGTGARFIGAQRLDPASENAGVGVPWIKSIGRLFVLTMAPDAVVALELSTEAMSAEWLKWLGWAKPQPMNNAIKVRWFIPAAGLGEWATPDLSANSARTIAAISSGSRLRLISLDDGTLLTPAMDLAACGERVSNVEIGADGAFTATVVTCRFTRPAPPAIADIPAVFVDRSELFNGAKR